MKTIIVGTREITDIEAARQDVRMLSYTGSPHLPRLSEQRRNVFTRIQNWLAPYYPLEPER